MKRKRSLLTSLATLNSAVSRFWPYLRAERVKLVGATLALVASVGLRLLEPWPLKFVIDDVLQGDGDRTLLLYCALALVVIIGLRSAADYANKVTLALIGNRVLAKVREKMYTHLQRLSLRYHSEARGGDLVIRVISDVNMLRDAAVTALLPLIGNVLVVVSMLGLMLWMDWRLACLALVALPVFVLMNIRLGKRIREVASLQRRREGAMAATAAESLAGIKTVQALALEEAFARDFIGRNDDARKADAKGARLSARLERTTDVVVAVATALVIYFGATLALEGSLTVGELVVFLTYLRRLFNPLQDFAKYTGRLAKASAAAERVTSVLDQCSEVQNKPNASSAPRFEGAIDLKDVSFRYSQDGSWVLRDVNLSLRPGETIALIGESGIGKSTLASLLLRLFDPVEGTILFDGRDIREFEIESLRKRIGCVLQESLLFSGTVHENIAFGVDATTEQVVAAAKLANAHNFIKAMPQGYESVVGERGHTLSAGQRQRIAVARAALRETSILILDEPTTGLDEENERLVRTALTQLSKNRTTILITHDLNHAAEADRVALITGGRLEEIGSPGDLTNGSGRYASLLRPTEKQEEETDAASR